MLTCYRADDDSLRTPGDVYPDDNESGLQNRWDDHLDWTDHFDDSELDVAWS